MPNSQRIKKWKTALKSDLVDVVIALEDDLADLETANDHQSEYIGELECQNSKELEEALARIKELEELEEVHLSESPAEITAQIDNALWPPHKKR